MFSDLFFCCPKSWNGGGFILEDFVILKQDFHVVRETIRQAFDDISKFNYLVDLYLYDLFGILEIFIGLNPKAV